MVAALALPSSPAPPFPLGSVSRLEFERFDHHQSDELDDEIIAPLAGKTNERFRSEMKCPSSSGGDETTDEERDSSFSSSQPGSKAVLLSASGAIEFHESLGSPSSRLILAVCGAMIGLSLGHGIEAFSNEEYNIRPGSCFPTLRVSNSFRPSIHPLLGFKSSKSTSLTAVTLYT